MFVLLTYDIDLSDGGKRLHKVAKCCEGYGVRVQNSVFEIIITDGDLTILKKKLSTIIKKETDSIRIYKIGKEKNVKIDIIGKKEKIEISEKGGILL